MFDDVLKRASILQDGTILLGNSVVCDGYHEDRTTAVFTHIHSDHISHFETALGMCDKILVSKPTFDLLVALKGEPISYRSNFIPMDFNTSYYNKLGEKITLFQSNHILGSSQVLVSMHDGTKILYSSDFNFPEINTIPCDILVMDSTHGDPRFDAIADSSSLERRLVELVTEEIESGKPVMIRAHRGRMQYVMNLLSQKYIGAVKFLADEIDVKLSKVYADYGLPCRPIIPINKNPEAYRIMNSGLPYIRFHTIGGPFTPEEESGMRTIRLSSDVRLLEGPALKEHAPNNFSIEISDHASFSNIIKYVKETNPKIVITDNVRTKSGQTLANEIKKQLGIEAFPSPP